ncbi:MAG: TlpA family protein disulfide reductase [Chitinophagaceae bacterium]|nr:MAG: TlpA family protein disulfide reductase [Chitinophagaceae bacterium]
MPQMVISAFRKLMAVTSLIMFCNTSIAQPKKGDTIPEISLRDTSGNVVALSSLRGKVVLIDFWASWCVPCRKSNPGLLKIYDKYRDKGFEIYGISIDQNTNAWKNAIVMDSLTWQHVNDNQGWDASVTMDWKVDFIPASFLVSKTGVLVAADPDHRKLGKYLKKNLK